MSDAANTTNTTQEAPKNEPAMDAGIGAPLLTEEMALSFASAAPFPHIVIDNFCDAELLGQVEKELREMPLQVWYSKRDPTSGEMATQKRKLAIKDAKAFGPATQRVMSAFSSPEMCKYLSALSGIEDLMPDADYLGGGAHRIDDGGKLSVHADFNIHPTTGLHRRLNALLYLNKEWKPENHGELELWEKDMSKCSKKVEPVFNRLVVFRITDDAYHGHPEPWCAPDGYARLSLAFYYYTRDRPENEKAPFHWANWKFRPGKGW